MPKTISDAARNRILDTVPGTNIDGLELIDSSSTVIAKVTGFSWNAASSGTIDVSGTPTATGTANAGNGSDAVEARLYDDSGASGDELDGLVVEADQNFSSWSTSTSYSQGDKVTNTINSTTFRFKATEAHTSDSQKEPGVGETWPDYWDLIDVVIDNTNIADGQTVDINSLVIAQPSTLQ
jgi:hypothetical protein